MSITYRNTKYDLDGPGVVIIRDEWPEWQKTQWLAALSGDTPDPQPFRPSFELAFVTDSITGAIVPLSYVMFADAATAQYIASKYGTGTVTEQPFLGPGPFVVDKQMLMITLADGRTVNAGVLAAYYERNPEDVAPGVADKLIRAQLGI